MKTLYIEFDLLSRLMTQR